MPCAICGEKNAPRGYGYAGHRKDRPSQAMLPCCTAPDCIAAAEVRWRAANSGFAADHTRGKVGASQEAGQQHGAEKVSDRKQPPRRGEDTEQRSLF